MSVTERAIRIESDLHSGDSFVYYGSGTGVAIPVRLRTADGEESRGNGELQARSFVDNLCIPCMVTFPIERISEAEARISG